ncbi:MAG: chemotaxis protein CheW, partial [Cyanobacteria bacterium J06598_4]
MNSLTTTDRLKELLPQLFSTQQRQGNYYLRFQLTDSINLLLNLRYVQESLTIDGSQITAVPNLPPYAVGLMNARNQVFLALDLAHLA